MPRLFKTTLAPFFSRGFDELNHQYMASILYRIFSRKHHAVIISVVSFQRERGFDQQATMYLIWATSNRILERKLLKLLKLMDSQIAAGDQAIKEGIPEKISSA